VRRLGRHLLRRQLEGLPEASLVNMRVAMKKRRCGGLNARASAARTSIT
jgi:hypothetical protein